MPASLLGEGSESNGGEYVEGEKARRWRLVSIAVLVMAIIAVVAVEFKRGSPASQRSLPMQAWEKAELGVEKAGPQCSGEGRPGEPVQDLHLHFLFMGMENLNHPDIWKDFFQDAPPGSYTVWVHCKFREKCQANLAGSGWTNFKLIPTVFSAWCKDLLSPMLQLVRHALAESIHPVGAPEKFIFLSPDFLPFKPFAVVRAELGKHPFASDFCLYQPSVWFDQGGGSNTVPSSQWSVLSRPDAEALVDRLPPPAPDHPLDIPPVDPTGHRIDYLCFDEGKPFSTIFGDFDTDDGTEQIFPGVGPVRFDLSMHEQGCCRTWRVQTGCPADFHKWAKHGTPMPAMLWELRQDSETQVAFPWQTGGSVLVIERLGPEGLGILRRSPFLFGRKFAWNAHIPGYAAIVFA